MKSSSCSEKQLTRLSQDSGAPAELKVSVEQISERAYHAWLKRGCTHGFDVEDWLEAERQLLNQELLMAEQDDDWKQI